MGQINIDTRTTNFEFLLLDWELKQKYYDRAKYIEDFYNNGSLKKMVEQIDKFEKELTGKNNLSNNLGLSGEIHNSDALVRLENLFNILKKIAIDAGQSVEVNFNIPNEVSQYQTNEQKLIYIQTADNLSGKWNVYTGSEKIGDTTAKNSSNPLDFQPNSEFLRKQASNRIKNYMTTSGVPFKIDWVELAYRPNNKVNPWFRDYDVHEVLRKSGFKKNNEVEGAEWWKVDLNTAKQAIEAVKENRESINSVARLKEEIILRPEQEIAINQTRKVFKTKNKMLWNAKMRFGKTLSTYQLIKDEQFKSVLILTHRPVVSDSWLEDFDKLNMVQSGYKYGSKKGESIESLVSCNTNFVYFASMQDLRGSEQVGGKQGEKNKLVFKTCWDLVVFDEAHEGTQTDLAQNVESEIIKPNTKILVLSGTPFNIIDQYSEDQVFTWDYVMEQEAKLRWNVENPYIHNPYESLPKVNMFTFEMNNKDKYSNESRAFNFKEFFKITEEGDFMYESDVVSFLNEITKDSDTNYPFSTVEYREELRHTLWLLPGVKEAKALKTLMDKHTVFGSEYSIINVVDKDDKEVCGKDDPDLARVRNAISDKPWKTKTITLTVRKLTTGVNVKEWSAVMFLNNMTSATTYLQAAFRAQTPSSNEVQGQKTNAYIFDFAPDRALTVMAESASINSGVGKKNTNEQKIKMDKMLNFLPIIGLQENEMKSFNVSQMLTQLKKVYAEKAVQSGFDDDSLYSDELLTINPEAAKLFEKLRGIIGKTGASKGAQKVKINGQGLTEEEYERAEFARKKVKKSKEDKALLKKVKEAKKERRNAISILRGISIRIPLMIFGMDVELSENIDIDRFIREVDDISWNEFMPAGVTKKMFKEQAKYYDPEVFIEAGRIIRERAKACDRFPYAERTKQIALLHSTFKNPDKETVLTPWRVVNMHLGDTVGGYNFFNDSYTTNLALGEGVEQNESTRFIEYDQITKTIFNSKSKILEINSKSGLYPLYMAYTIYQIRWNVEQGNWNKSEWIEKDEELWNNVLKENIFVLNKSPMARAITYRTLNGYKEEQSVMQNLVYIENLTDKLKLSVKNTALEIKRNFGGENMNFDVIVGNPPYQENDKVDNKGSASPLYHQFIDLSRSLEPNYISLITPSVWFLGGKGLDKFRESMLDDKHFRKFTNYITAKDVFSNVNLRGGVNYFLWDKTYNNNLDEILVEEYMNMRKISSNYREFKFEKQNLFISDNIGYKILKKTNKISNEHNSGSFMNIVSERNPYGFSTTFRFDEVPSSSKKQYKIYASRDRIGYVDSNLMLKGKKSLKNIKVITPFANNIGTDLKDNNLNTKVIGANEIVTETYLVIGPPLNLTSTEACYIEKYLKTKFVKYLISLAKANQNGTRQTYRFVPLEEFKINSNSIDWSLSINEINEQLYKKYKLSQEEIDFIEMKIS